MAPALLRVGVGLFVIYAAIGVGLGWWGVVEAGRLTADPGNPLVQAAREAPRGQIVDARGVVLAESVKDGDGGYTRRYPHPEAEPLLGYLSPQFGASGLERSYGPELLGIGDATGGGALLRKLRHDPYDEQDLLLSLDLRLQRRAMRLLRGERGAIVAIEPATGRILAMASTPTYDPNRIVDPEKGAAYFQSLLDRPEEDSALLDRATRGVYTPGSVLKMVTAVAGLGSDAITPETVYPTQPAEEKTGMIVEGFKIRDGHHPQTGDEALALRDATSVSCNIYFAHTGLNVGGDAFLDWGARLGFGSPIPFDVPTAASTLDGGDGFVDDVELANAAYGQGQTQATPLQMALVAATIAERGSLMEPHVVDGLRDASGSVDRIEPSVWRQVLDRGRAESIARAMRAAVESRLGRPYAGKAKIPGVPTAGKSGTAELGGEGEPDSWFIGFAPADDPQIAVAVIVEGGGTGSEAAVPIGGRLMGDWLTLLE
ncbi:MAG: penicillin-binding protein 2 [Candidatus Limnocylindrales bacterium]